MLQENEMREFFNRVIGDFVGLTESANKVEALSRQVDELSNRIYTLEQENNNLRRDLTEQVEHTRMVKDNLQLTQTELYNSQEHAKALQETIINADSRVTDLTRINDEAMANIDQTARERDEARSSVKDYEVLTSDLRQQVSEVTLDRDHWKEDAQRNAETIVELKATLSRVQSILNPTSNVEPFPQFNVG